MWWWWLRIRVRGAALGAPLWSYKIFVIEPPNASDLCHKFPNSLPRVMEDLLRHDLGSRFQEGPLINLANITKFGELSISNFLSGKL